MDPAINIIAIIASLIDILSPLKGLEYVKC